MEESEYKSTYNELASVSCAFEKALTNNQLKCRLSRHFCLADREGYACKDAESSANCSKFLQILREKSVFALKLREIGGPLPHNMEIRVQAGGIKGVAKAVTGSSVSSEADEINTDDAAAADVNSLLYQAVKCYGALSDLPYSDIIQSVVQFKGRSRRQR